MKDLKKVYYANWWVLAITALLYLTIWIGAMLHILFGVFQLVIAFYLLYDFKNLSKSIQQQLICYFILTIITISTTFIFQDDIVVYTWFATWALALYFIGILYQKTKIDGAQL